MRLGCLRGLFGPKTEGWTSLWSGVVGLEPNLQDVVSIFWPLPDLTVGERCLAPLSPYKSLLSSWTRSILLHWSKTTTNLNLSLVQLLTLCLLAFDWLTCRQGRVVSRQNDQPTFRSFVWTTNPECGSAFRNQCP